jgi:hypothetical protein
VVQLKLDIEKFKQKNQGKAHHPSSSVDHKKITAKPEQDFHCINKQNLTSLTNRVESRRKHLHQEKEKRIAHAKTTKKDLLCQKIAHKSKAFNDWQCKQENMLEAAKAAYIKRIFTKKQKFWVQVIMLFKICQSFRLFGGIIKNR